ncbi:MAG: hypothetical protein ACI9HY_002249 [Planctomycetaceae bacterium]|jgi:hypothetical protein
MYFSGTGTTAALVEQVIADATSSTPGQLTEIGQATGRHLGKRIIEMSVRMTA